MRTLEPIGCKFDDTEIQWILNSPISSYKCPDCCNQLRQNLGVATYYDCVACEVQFELQGELTAEEAAQPFVMNTVEDVERWHRELVIPFLGGGYHPDDSAAGYINMTTRKDTFTPEQCVTFDTNVERAFEVCEEAGADIYEIGLKVLREQHPDIYGENNETTPTI